MPYRTTLSVVYWTDSSEDAERILGLINSHLPQEDRDSTLRTIEAKPEGRPAGPIPAASSLNVETEDGPEPEPELEPETHSDEEAAAAE